MSAPTIEPDPLPQHYKAIQSTKTYGHEIGFSCAFRQWKAESHCRFIHGYALGFKFTFAANELDKRGWVVDFGGLKDLRALLEGTFDHKLLVAADDPRLAELLALGKPQVIGFPNHDTYPETGYPPDCNPAPAADVIVVPATGCEAFARMVFDVTEGWLKDAGFAPRCWLVSVEVMEHGANSAICFG